ncbi:MAG: protein translocase subunit SecF, partial [Methylococcales bacterium]|nr:protein translocase subunit SecF [Methylococcales bacterium]
MNKTFDFMGKRKLAMIVSLVLVLVSLVLVVTRGLNFGIDFTGGTVVEMGYQQSADLDQIRTSLADNGYDRAVVQYFGSSREVSIRLAPSEGEDHSALGAEIVKLLSNSSGGDAEMRSIGFVGPQ